MNKMIFLNTKLHICPYHQTQQILQVCHRIFDLIWIVHKQIDAFLLLVRLIGQILSNGRCKSVKHRALVNKERERTSIVVAYGPSIDAVVGPAAPLVKKDGHLKYGSMKYEDYIALQQTKICGSRSLLEERMIKENQTKI